MTRPRLTYLAILGIVGVAGVAELTILVAGSASTGRWDLAADTWVHLRSTATGLQLFWILSWLGSPIAWGIAAASTLVLLTRGHGRLAVGWVVIFGGGKLLELLLKFAVHRARPVYAAPYIRDHSFSFPSGHAVGAVLCYGLLAYTLRRTWLPAERHPIVVAAGAVVIILGVSVARIYLGVHFPSDVAGGLLLGSTWLTLGVFGLEWSEQHGDRRAG